MQLKPRIAEAEFEASPGQSLSPTLPSIKALIAVADGVCDPPLTSRSKINLSFAQAVSSINYVEETDHCLLAKRLDLTRYVPDFDLDTSDIFDRAISQELKGKSLGDCLALHFDRCQNRAVYGLESTAHSRGDCDSVDPASINTGKQKVNRHPKQERDRRERHRLICKEMGCQCADIHFNLAENYLSELKQVLGHERPRHRSRSKTAGKDELFLATVFQQRISELLIRALVSAISNQQAQLDVAVEPTRNNKRSRCDDEESQKRPRLTLPVRNRTSDDLNDNSLHSPPKSKL